MIKELFIVAALTASPTPAENYFSSISQEAADHILEDVLAGNYHEYLDFNGDGQLTIADYVGVLKRHQDNETYGNEITVDRETVQAIVEENYQEDMIYYEIDFVNDEVCRKHELTVSDITTANIYVEFEETSDNIEIRIDPFTETVKVTN